MFDAIRSCFTRLFTPTPTQPIAVIFVTEEPEPARAEVCWATTRPSWDRSPKLASGLVKSPWYSALVEEFEGSHYGSISWLPIFIKDATFLQDCEEVASALDGGEAFDELARQTLTWIQEMYADGGYRSPAITLDDCKIWIAKNASYFQSVIARWQDAPSDYLIDFDS